LEFVDGREELLGARQRQVGLLREVLPEESVGVLVAAALPGAVGIAEEHRDAGGLAELLVARHLDAAVPGRMSRVSWNFGGDPG
jgi:hypothetical protein